MEKSLTDLLREEIGKVSPKDRENRTWAELIIQATLLLAIKGNSTALKILWNTCQVGDDSPIDLSKLSDEELLALQELAESGEDDNDGPSEPD